MKIGRFSAPATKPVLIEGPTDLEPRCRGFYIEEPGRVSIRSKFGEWTLDIPVPSGAALAILDAQRIEPDDKVKIYALY